MAQPATLRHRNPYQDSWHNKTHQLLERVLAQPTVLKHSSSYQEPWHNLSKNTSALSKYYSHGATCPKTQQLMVRVMAQPAVLRHRNSYKNYGTICHKTHQLGKGNDTTCPGLRLSRSLKVIQQPALRQHLIARVMAQPVLQHTNHNYQNLSS